MGADECGVDMESLGGSRLLDGSLAGGRVKSFQEKRVVASGVDAVRVTRSRTHVCHSREVGRRCS